MLLPMCCKTAFRSRLHVFMYCLALSLCSVPVRAGQRGVAGLKGDGMSVEQPAWVLNGSGLSSKAFVDLYFAELYLLKRASTADAVLKAKGEKKLVMHIKFFGLSGKLISTRLREGIRANTDNDEFQRARPHMDAIETMFSSGKALSRGDVLVFEFLQGARVRFLVNGEVRGCVEDRDFPEILMRVWLGESPVNPALKAGLLGIEQSASR